MFDDLDLDNHDVPPVKKSINQAALPGGADLAFEQESDEEGFDDFLER